MTDEGVLALELHVQRREVLRALGYPRARTPAPRVAQALDALWDVALGLLAPRGVFRLVRAEAVSAAQVPRPTPLIAVGLCTIGPALENEVARRQAAGQTLEPLILDALGSAGAEAAADALNQQICLTARRRGLYPRPRISPGYGRWDIKAQPALLALLPAEAAGVRLSAGMMMLPRKSVSFAARLTAEPPSAPPEKRCARCGLTSCAYRER